MPKIIENLEDRLIREAERQIAQSGYGAVTVRSIAKGCGVGVGTVYNYFPSKEAIIATLLLADWKSRIGTIRAVATYSESPRSVVLCIYDQLKEFARNNAPVFRDEAAVSGFAGSFSKYHSLLREQLADPLKRFCGSEFTALFIAESLLTWTMAEKPVEEIYAVVEKLF